VVCNGQLSSIWPVQYGLPQGSVLRPILFVLYTTDVSLIIARHGLKFHQYADNAADDCQINVSSPVSAAHSSVDQFSCCPYDVKA